MPKDVSNEYLVRPEIKPAKPLTIGAWRKLAKAAQCQVDRLTVLRNFLSTLEPQRFDMRNWTIGARNIRASKLANECGTTGCIAGWANHIMRSSGHSGYHMKSEAQQWLKLTPVQADHMFVPTRHTNEDTTPAQAVAMIDHFIATGEIIWKEDNA
jgi:hypothetical protein